MKCSHITWFVISFSPLTTAWVLSFLSLVVLSDSWPSGIAETRILRSFLNNLMPWYLWQSSHILHKFSFPPGFVAVNLPEHLTSVAPGLASIWIHLSPGIPLTVVFAQLWSVTNWGIWARGETDTKGSFLGVLVRASQAAPDSVKPALLPLPYGKLLLESNDWSFYCPLAMSVTDLFYDWILLNDLRRWCRRFRMPASRTKNPNQSLSSWCAAQLGLDVQWTGRCSCQSSGAWCSPKKEL